MFSTHGTPAVSRGTTQASSSAVTAGRSDLLAVLNDGLHRVRVDGTYDALYDEWFGVLHPKGLLESRTTRALAAPPFAPTGPSPSGPMASR